MKRFTWPKHLGRIIAVAMTALALTTVPTLVALGMPTSNTGTQAVAISSPGAITSSDPTIVVASASSEVATVAPASATTPAQAEPSAALNTPNQATATPPANTNPAPTPAAENVAPAAAPEPVPAPTPVPVVTPGPSEQEQAQAILDSYVAKYPILAGTTITFGDARGYQAITYYQSGRIILSATHTASLATIIRHEIGHVIDWRDNGVIDWGESIPAL
ncbi:MAG: hypothetical protein HGA39_08215 [Coriobacteriia bacterium]|nr:hypothetical protein [Coriobacteriia bacterium]